jgi:hypothetical protein
LFESDEGSAQIVQLAALIGIDEAMFGGFGGQTGYCSRIFLISARAQRMPQ